MFASIVISIGMIAVGILTWRALQRQEKKRGGLCPRCSYDLRGTNHSRCPECGMPM